MFMWYKKKMEKITTSPLLYHYTHHTITNPHNSSFSDPNPNPNPNPNPFTPPSLSLSLSPPFSYRSPSSSLPSFLLNPFWGCSSNSFRGCTNYRSTSSISKLLQYLVALIRVKGIGL